MKEFKVTTWNNGKPNYQTGSGLGLKVRPLDRNTYFSRQYKEVLVSLDGRDEYVSVNIDKESFWKECSELIHKDIGIWLIKNKYNKWRYRKPHKLSLYFLRENIFSLKKQPGH